MSSIRKLKKDIDYMIYEVISDCFTAMSVQPMEKSEDIALLISDAVKLRNEMFSRAKHPGGKENPAVTRDYYKSVKKDFLKEIDSLFDRLSRITRSESEG